MTCPSCGTIAAMGAERCARCRSSLLIPANRPDVPTPVVRAPTARGQIAQRSAGIVTVSLVPHTPEAAAIPSPPAAPPALGGPVGRPAPYEKPPVPAPYGAPSPQPTWAPPDPATAVPAPQAPAGWATQPPPPPPSLGTAATAAPPVGPAPTTQTPQPDPTTAYPTAAPLGNHPAAPESPRNDDGDEVRPRTVRPGVDASWPPPPGPWSGRRTTES